jgi:hypothetical protein
LPSINQTFLLERKVPLIKGGWGVVLKEIRGIRKSLIKKKRRGSLIKRNKRNKK